ncbi:MAG: GAF domain-containing protein [Betaproteobacteria bacterium]|nr:GAF domain-containing protein [Betaproteobacteria bacterium]
MSIPIRILIVEDSPDDAQLMLDNLVNHGIAPQAERVETEADYLAGLNAAPDVILADYRLPQFSGPRALELLNERRLDIPFIVVSGDIGDEEAAGLIKLGASDFLLKDRMARLGPAVTHALKLKRARDEQRLMEEALVKSEQRFRALSENSSDLMIVIDGRDMITYISPSLKRIGGYEIGDALDRNFRDFIHPEDVAALTTSLAAVVQNPDELRVVELRSPHKNGNWLTFETILRNALDEPTIGGIVVNARDITERKKQEQKIARLNRIHAVLSGINSVIVRVRDRQELFNDACRIAVEHGGFGIAWIGVLNQETLEITPAACAGVDAESFLARSPNTARPDTPMGQGVVGRAIREKRAVSSNDITTEPGAGGERRRDAARRGYRSSISLPLLMEGAAVGNFSLFAKEANFFTADEVKLLTELAGDISFALDHIAKEEKLNYLAYYDALTGLPNRALFDDRIRGTR